MFLNNHALCRSTDEKYELERSFWKALWRLEYQHSGSSHAMEFICNLDKDLGTKIQNKGAQESSLEGSITAPSHNGVLTTTKYSNITTCSREADMTYRREVWGESGIQNDMGSAKGHLERGLGWPTKRFVFFRLL